MENAVNTNYFNQTKAERELTDKIMEAMDAEQPETGEGSIYYSDPFTSTVGEAPVVSASYSEQTKSLRAQIQDELDEIKRLIAQIAANKGIDISLVQAVVKTDNQRIEDKVESFLISKPEYYEDVFGQLPRHRVTTEAVEAMMLRAEFEYELKCALIRTHFYGFGNRDLCLIDNLKEAIIRLPDFKP